MPFRTLDLRVPPAVYVHGLGSPTLDGGCLHIFLVHTTPTNLVLSADVLVPFKLPVFTACQTRYRSPILEIQARRAHFLLDHVY